MNLKMSENGGSEPLALVKVGLAIQIFNVFKTMNIFVLSFIR